MDTQALINDIKIRFNHNSAKEYLKDKYQSKLIIADQNGLWKADAQTIALLNNFSGETLVLIDTFNNPVLVNRQALLTTLSTIYEKVMADWYAEWKDLESKR